MDIELLLCWGTIDKSYFPVEEVFSFDKTHIDQMINQARIKNLNINFKKLFFKDSLDMNNDDRLHILKECKKSKSNKILIMHWTSTMTDSAKIIAKEDLWNKVIVFFWAMLPYELSKSDAIFNFWTAISSCQLLAPWVYISMNGKTWRYDKVVKKVSKGAFIDKN